MIASTRGGSRHHDAGRWHHKMKMVLTTVLLILVCLLNVVSAQEKEKEWAEKRRKAGAYVEKADLRLYFVTWTNIWIYNPPTTNGEVITQTRSMVKTIDEALAKPLQKKKLAVVEISTAFHNHFDSRTKDAVLQDIEERIHTNGFEKVVFLSETAIGDVILKE